MIGDSSFQPASGVNKMVIQLFALSFEASESRLVVKLSHSIAKIAKLANDVIPIVKNLGTDLAA